MATYSYTRKGAPIVAAFERLLKTGDVEKITPGLYHALTQHGGFIAHFDIHGFRATFKGDLTQLLAGEFYRLDDPELWAPERMRHLEDCAYSDGLSAGDVMRMIARIGARMGETVRLRERALRDAAERELLARLATKHGLTVS